MYVKLNYKNDIIVGYIQDSNCRGEDTINLRKKINEAFEKLHDKNFGYER
jgi:hypothetical protein